MHDITTSELSHWVAISQVLGVGISRIKKLLAEFGTVESIFKANKIALKTQGLTDAQIHQLKNPNKDNIKNSLTWAERESHYILPFTDTRFPPLLLETGHAPVLLHIHGDYHYLSHPQIAIVGSRKPSHTGLELAAEFSQQLAHAGFCITSGLAYGIDTACHEGALSVSGKTIAVLGSGLLSIYPKKNLALAEQITQNGCVISELPLQTGPLAENFPRRNRIISGLSLGTVVVEAAIKSGSLITAHFAAEQGREVFAIPGSIRNPVSKGCLSLIQEGAKCVMSVLDILEEIMPITQNYYPISQPATQENRTQTLDCTDEQVLACIEYDTTTIDQIVNRSKLSAQRVTAILLTLELQGVVKRQMGGYIKVISRA